MAYSQDQGYVPVDIESIMLAFMGHINTNFQTTYTVDTFKGTNLYKNAYAWAQRQQANEVKTSEIFEKLKNYFKITNERISRPVNTSPGIVDKLAMEGYTSSVKPMVDADAGKVNVCVDVDNAAVDYATKKLAICTLLSQITVGGSVTQGTEIEPIVLSNGQSFDYKFHLPNRIDIKLKLTITLSENNQVLIQSPEEIKNKLMSNIATSYKLGKNFEPQRYYSVVDAPWSSQVKLEYSQDNGVTWADTIFNANFDDIFTFGLDDITLVEV